MGEERSLKYGWDKFETVLIIVLFLTLESVMIDLMCKYNAVCRESMSQARGHVVCRACHKPVVTWWLRSERLA